jgi:hypothetical protein
MRITAILTVACATIAVLFVFGKPDSSPNFGLSSSARLLIGFAILANGFWVGYVIDILIADVTKDQHRAMAEAPADWRIQFTLKTMFYAISIVTAGIALTLVRIRPPLYFIAQFIGVAVAGAGIFLPIRRPLLGAVMALFLLIVISAFGAWNIEITSPRPVTAPIIPTQPGS